MLTLDQVLLWEQCCFFGCPVLSSLHHSKWQPGLNRVRPWVRGLLGMEKKPYMFHSLSISLGFIKPQIRLNTQVPFPTPKRQYSQGSLTKGFVSNLFLSIYSDKVMTYSSWKLMSLFYKSSNPYTACFLERKWDISCFIGVFCPSISLVL